MSYPFGTLEAALDGRIDRIDRAAEELATEADALGHDLERQDFYRAAAAGAKGYAARLVAVLARAEHVTDRMLDEADLVTRAAECAGWLSASAFDGMGHRQGAVAELVDAGVFAYFPAVPGRWVACYRLVAPA